jgi:sentrin-specific protease 1
MSVVITDTHIQSSRAREDGTTTLKRQKMRPSASRSKSVVDESRKMRRDRLDYTGCVTMEDKRMRTEDFWEPPDFGLVKSTKYERPRTPESLLGDEQDEDHPRSYRRRSDPCISPMTPESMANPSRSQEDRRHVFKTTRSLASRRLEASRSEVKEAGAAIAMSLDERMNLLLVSPDDDKETPLLAPSRYMVEKRAQLAKERKIKEREAAIRLAKERRLNRRNPKQPLVQELAPIWKAKVVQLLSASHQQVITTTIEGTELRIKDFQTLLGQRAWLNDEIVNGYLLWIVDAANKAAAAESISRGEEVNSVPKFIAHNSFFYKILSEKGPSSTERLMKRKKAPGKSLMDVDSVFVPICKNNHWTVGVVRPVAKTIEYFDSFGGSPTDFVKLMRGWLKFQLRDGYIEEEWKVPNTASARQTNGYDCGVFACTNSLCVALGLHTSCYDEGDLRQQRENIAAVLINKGFIGDFAWRKERV